MNLWRLVKQILELEGSKHDLSTQLSGLFSNARTIIPKFEHVLSGPEDLKMCHNPPLKMKRKCSHIHEISPIHPSSRLTDTQDLFSGGYHFPYLGFELGNLSTPSSWTNSFVDGLFNNVNANEDIHTPFNNNPFSHPINEIREYPTNLTEPQNICPRRNHNVPRCATDRHFINYANCQYVYDMIYFCG